MPSPHLWEYDGTRQLGICPHVCTEAVLGTFHGHFWSPHTCTACEAPGMFNYAREACSHALMLTTRALTAQHLGLDHTQHEQTWHLK